MNKLAKKMDVFFHSDLYLIVLTLIAAIGLYFRYEVLTIIIISVITVISWLFSEDILPTFIVVALIGLIGLSIPRGDELIHFRPLYYTPIYVVPAFIVKLFIHPFKFKKGLFLWPTVIVAIAVTIGGLFSISVQEYFALTTLYYTFGLGIGMVIIYFVLERYLINKAQMAEYFAKMMVSVGFIGFFMLFAAYLEKFETLTAIEIGSHFQWRNNLSNTLLLSMPFAFYLATYKRFSAFYLLIGVLQYLALIFSYSRGGVLFGTLVFPLIIVLTYRYAQHNRLKLTGIFLIIFGILYLIFEQWMVPFTEIYADLRARLSVSDTEARANLYRMAWANFKAYPIFGTGLGFDTSEFYNPKTMSMYWVHSTLFQILGSLGLIGLLAYIYQESVRLRVLWCGPRHFNVFVFLSMLGFAGYSMVNIGYFAPLPFVAMFLTMFMVVERHNQMKRNA